MQREYLASNITFQPTDIVTATYASTSQPVHLTDSQSTINRSLGLTQLPGPWKLLNTSSLSLPDFGVESKCTDVICSNFIKKEHSSCARTVYSHSPKAVVIPSCHFQDWSSNIRVLLLSYPGSGNTWIRQLLERSSGICTGK